MDISLKKPSFYYALPYPEFDAAEESDSLHGALDDQDFIGCWQYYIININNVCVKLLLIYLLSCSLQYEEDNEP